MGGRKQGLSSAQKYQFFTHCFDTAVMSDFSPKLCYGLLLPVGCSRGIERLSSAPVPEFNLPPVSRRHFIAAGLAGASAAAAPGLVGVNSASAAVLPTVRPLSSHKVYEAFGVCSHPNFGKTGYKYTSQWMAALASTGASYLRGMYVHDLAATPTTIKAARSHGIKWGMAVCPDDWGLSDQGLIARIKHIAQYASDICLYVEGVNEPNHERDGSRPASDWPQRTLSKQRLIWQTVKGDSRLSHVKVVGPSLQAVEGTESQYKLMGDLGIAQYMDYAAMHRYHGG
ncbi:MAG: hypothetical protein H0V49_02080, partial [Nocardioidaceae bacterium]|nr:hypothetical protein [Nocardioidaceae bacterium]